MTPTSLLALAALACDPTGPSVAPPDPAEADRPFLFTYSSRRGPKKYLEWLAKDGINLFTRPYFWNGSDWRDQALGGGATISALAVDEPIHDWFQDHPSRRRASFLDDVERIYSGPVLDYGPLALLVSGLVSKNEKLADSGFLSLESVYYAGRVSAVFKSLTHRERPRTAEDPFEFHGPGGSTIADTSAFISGHTISAFAFASSMSEVWKKKWLTGTLYGLSTLIALQRLDSDVHWTSDVLGAAIAGRALGKRIVRFHDPVEREEDATTRHTRPAWTPVIGDEFYGAMVTLRIEPQRRSVR